MQSKIDTYFESTDIPTMAGLALFLGFNDRHALSEYEHRDEEFSATVKKARTRIEAWREEALLCGQGNVAGIIFALKNCHGWRDRQDINHSGDKEQPLGVVMIPAKTETNWAELIAKAKACGHDQ